MNETTAQIISKKIGSFLKIDKHDEDIGGKFLCFKERIRIKEPLLRGLTIKVQEKEIWIPMKYESLPLICFHCRKMGHIVKSWSDYEGEVDDALSQWNYGAWVKASPLKQRRELPPMRDFPKMVMFQDSQTDTPTHTHTAIPDPPTHTDQKTDKESRHCQMSITESILKSLEKVQLQTD